MKNGKKPTLKQKRFLQEHNLVPTNWLVIKDTPDEIELISKAAAKKGTGKTKIIKKVSL